VGSWLRPKIDCEVLEQRPFLSPEPLTALLFASPDPRRPSSILSGHIARVDRLTVFYARSRRLRPGCPFLGKNIHLYLQASPSPGSFLELEAPLPSLVLTQAIVFFLFVSLQKVTSRLLSGFPSPPLLMKTNLPRVPSGSLSYSHVRVLNFGFGLS